MLQSTGLQTVRHNNNLKVQGLLPSGHLSDFCSIIQVEDELGLN